MSSTNPGQDEIYPGETPAPARLPPPGFQLPGRWYSLRGLTTALTVLLILVAVEGLLAVAARANRITVASDILKNPPLPGFENAGLVNRANTADGLVGATNALAALLALAIGVLVIIWTWRAMKNNEMLGRQRPRFTSGWGIAGWLIPLANLVIPVLIFQDLWRGSDVSVDLSDPNQRAPRGSSLVGWWWAAWLLSIGRVGTFPTTGDARALRTSDAVALGGYVFWIAAAVLLVRILRDLTRRQEACRGERPGWGPLPASESSAPPPVAGAGWFADPAARFEYRYWDGHAWTDQVSRQGQATRDPSPLPGLS
jgi:hypothetical protein